jgi:hypothetical protein
MKYTITIKEGEIETIEAQSTTHALLEAMHILRKRKKTYAEVKKSDGTTAGVAYKSSNK